MDANEELKKMMEEMASKNPKMKMLASLLEQNNENNSTHGSEKLNAFINQQNKLIKKLQKTNKTLIDNLECMIARNDMLAEALGACPDCWGEDPSCESCGGNGRPGNYEINQLAFETYVLPCLTVVDDDEIKKTNDN